MNPRFGLHKPSDAPDLQLGALSIWIRGRTYPDDDDFWDGNWLDVLIQVATSHALVQAEGAILHASELASLVDACRTMHETLRGEFDLDCMEPALRLHLSLNPRGQLAFHVDLTADVATQRHHFEFELDQTYLTDFILAGDEALRRFPVCGTPDRSGAERKRG
jgi:hypothetical protein